MIGIVLQFGQPVWVQAVSIVSELLTVVLGLAISYIAFQGYRRNGSRPMLFVAVGFVLVFFVPFALFPVSILFPSVAESVGQVSLGIFGTVSRVLGLVSILYGLRMPLRR